MPSCCCATSAPAQSSTAASCPSARSASAAAPTTRDTSSSCVATTELWGAFTTTTLPTPTEHAAPASITLRKPGPATGQTRTSSSFTETADPPAGAPNSPPLQQPSQDSETSAPKLRQVGSKGGVRLEETEGRSMYFMPP